MRKFSKIQNAFVFALFLALVTGACGGEINSELKSGASYQISCNGRVITSVCGKQTVYKFKATTYKNSDRTGFVDGCFYPSQSDAKNWVRGQCNLGSAYPWTCDPESNWQLSSIVFNNQCTPINTDSDGDGISDDRDSCPSQRETVNNYQDNDGCPDITPVQVKNLQIIKFGSLNWIQAKSFSYQDWSGVAWTAQILGDGTFSTIKFGTLNWLAPQKNIQIKRLVIENGQELEQNVLLEVAGSRFQYIINGTLNWNVVPNFEFRSWELVDGQITGGRSTVEIVR